MKAKVLKRFRDRHNGKIYHAGDVIIISKDRFNEIISVGEFVEEIKKTEPKE